MKNLSLKNSMIKYLLSKQHTFVCYLRQICPEVTEILDNKVTYPKYRNLLTRTT